MDDQIAHIYRLFINRVDCYLGWHDRWVLKRRSINPLLLQRAMSGELPLGIQAVTKTGVARWTCLDADDDALLSRLFEAARAQPEGSSLLELSRRGGHLWLFHQVLPWEQAHVQGVALAEQFGLGDIEVYPKHGGLHAVRLPGTVHPKSGITYPAVDRHSGELLDLATLLPTLGAKCFQRAAPLSSTPQRARQRRPTFNEPRFERLVAALEPLTSVKIYSPGRASAICPWHDDTHPSLYIKGQRFHCLACGVWGDEYDVRRFVTSGTRPPTP